MIYTNNNRKAVFLIFMNKNIFNFWKMYALFIGGSGSVGLSLQKDKD